MLYANLRPSADQIESQRPYWAYTLQRLGKYANILTWEITNEYLGNEAFQKAAAEYFQENDPYTGPCAPPTARPMMPHGLIGLGWTWPSITRAPLPASVTT